METKKRFWIEYYYPGSIVSNTSQTDIDELKKPEMVYWPENAYAFSLNEQKIVINDGDEFKENPKQIGPQYYHRDSKITDYEQTKKHPNSTDILLCNMKSNGWNKLIWNRFGKWPQPYNPKKIKILV